MVKLIQNKDQIEVKHKLPECFNIKIIQDADMKELLSGKVVPLLAYGALKRDIDLTRYSCQMFIKKQRGGPSGGGGTPVAGGLRG